MGPSERRTTKVLLVDDHAPFLRTARLLLAAGGYDVVGEAGTATEGFDQALLAQPDLVVIDIALQDGSGIALAARLAELRPRPRTVLVSSRDAEDYSAAARASGAAGFLTRAEFSIEELEALIDDDPPAAAP
ncbi:MAG: response regulator receiver protein [Conexibacter sp.]|nr:response regulator receiver protein [Conexibacter sp.]